MSDIPTDERDVLKALFKEKWPQAAHSITRPKDKFYAYSCTLWLGFTEGYKIGKKGFKVEVR